MQFWRYLEHLFILLTNSVDINCAPYIWNKIFSNGFPCLETCSAYRMNLTIPVLSWKSVLSLRILKIGDIDIRDYRSILLHCPNLRFLQFTRLSLYCQPVNTIQHMNLKKLVIVIPWFEAFSRGSDIADYFMHVPNLEQFTFHRTDESKSIDESYLKFDWYKSVIDRYFPAPAHLTHYFHILKSSRSIGSINQGLICKMQENFYYVHRHLCQCRFVLDLMG